MILVLKEVPRNKPVQYFGVELIVPSWTKFVATDNDGETFAFETEPNVSKTNLWWTIENGFRYCQVAVFRLNGTDFEKTLVNVT